MPSEVLTVGSLFSGIGGMDLGFNRAGMRIAWRCETNEPCRTILRRMNYEPCFGDVRSLLEKGLYDDGPERVNLIAGGDPCPKHSRARSNGASQHPDLSGYFLAVVGRLRPEWVVRENVPAPTVAEFDAALAALGYGTVVIRLDSAGITGQSRQRDFICGRLQRPRLFVRDVFSDAEDGAGPYTTRLGARQVAPCLTTHRTRYDSRDCYVWEDAGGLRILDATERERLAGLPEGWTYGFSQATRARMCGNAVPPQMTEWIGRRIVEVERGQ